MNDAMIDIPTDGTLLHALVDTGRLVRVEDDLSTLLEEVATAAWADVGAEVSRALHRLGGVELFDGVSLYDVEVRTAPDWTRSVQRRGAGALVLRIASGRNTILASATTPTLLGSYADPRISMDFGLLVSVVVSVPTVVAPLRVTAVEDLRILVGRIDSQNLPADILQLGVRLAAAVADVSIEGTVQQALDALDLAGRATAQLGPLNERLSSLAGDGYAYQELLAGDQAGLARQLAEAYGIPDAAAALQGAGAPTGTQCLLLVSRRPDRSGVVEGEIAWRSDAGYPLRRSTAAALDRLVSSYLVDDTLTTARHRIAVADTDPGRWARLSLQPLRQVVAETAPSSEPAAVVSALVADTAARAPLATAATLTVQRPFSTASVWDAAAPPPDPAPQAAPLRFGADDVADALGGRQGYDRLMDLFRLGPVQFDVRCTNPSGQPAGSTTMMWHDDDESGWSRRRYRMESVETGVPLSVTCALAQDWVWRGGTLRSVEPVNWTGRVTVRPASDLDVTGSLTSERLHATVVQGDGSRRTVSLRALEEAGVIGGVRRGQDRSIIVVGGRPADEVSLNPQPLPPKERAFGRWFGGGGLADEVSLNPQPLPPKERAFGRWFGGGGLADEVSLNPQPLPPKERAFGRWFGGAFGRRRTDDQVPAVAGAWQGGGTSVQGRASVVEHVAEQVAELDDFGSLHLTDLDIQDITVPDVADPTGYGTVHGVDFRVRADGAG